MPCVNFAVRIADAPGETWAGIQSALRLGQRGLPEGAHDCALARYTSRSRAPGLPTQVERTKNRGVGAGTSPARRRVAHVELRANR